MRNAVPRSVSITANKSKHNETHFSGLGIAVPTDSWDVTPALERA